MLHGKKLIVVMPAYNAEKTIEDTYREIPLDIVDDVILVDDKSSDRTTEVARKLGLSVYVHEENRGYGANQKTCYELALKKGADIVIMLHPDYQYPPSLIYAMAGIITREMFDMVLGSRVLGGMALKGGMPLYKYAANRLLTAIENILLGTKLSEYHTGYRAYTRKLLLDIPLLENSDDFVFDNQVITQAIYFGYRIGEISSPCSYHKEASSINLRRSIIYGFSVLVTALKFVFQKRRLGRFSIFNPEGRKIGI